MILSKLQRFFKPYLIQWCQDCYYFAPDTEETNTLGRCYLYQYAAERNAGDLACMKGKYATTIEKMINPDE